MLRARGGGRALHRHHLHRRAWAASDRPGVGAALRGARPVGGVRFGFGLRLAFAYPGNNGRATMSTGRLPGGAMPARHVGSTEPQLPIQV